MSLVTTITQIRSVSSINVSNTVENWQPYLDESLDIFILPLIGEDLYNEMLEHVDAEESGSSEDPWQELIEKTRKPLILYALFLGIDEISVSIDAAGVMEPDSEQFRPAPQYKVLNLKERWLSRAHRNMDLLLTFLETNKSTFTDYESSYYEFFIQSAEEFSKYVDIRESRRVFIALKPVIRSIERKYILPTLSEDLFDELKAAIQASATLSDDD